LDTKYATGSPSCVLWDDNWRTWYADSAYRFVEHEEKLAADNMPGQICEKDTLGHPLTDAQKETNWVKSNVRALVEHIFSAQAQKWGAYRAHHRLMAGAGEDRDDEPGLQYKAFGTPDHTRYEDLLPGGLCHQRD